MSGSSMPASQEPPWLLTSPAAAKVAAVVVALDVLGILVALPVVMSDLVRQHPVPLSGWLVVPATGLVIVGQGFAILATRADPAVLARGGTWRRVERGPRRARRSEMGRAMFGALPRPLRFCVIGAAVVMWLAAMTSLTWMSRGGPGHSLPGCPYVLNNHGTYTCVSHDTFLRASAAVQKFVVAILAMFFLIHAGVAWNARKVVERTSLRPR